MGNGAKIAIASVVCFILLIVIFICTSISYKNKEVKLRNLVKMKQEDNKNTYDNTWKKISQAAEVTDAQKHALLELVTGYAQARGGGGGSLVKVITEVVPDLNPASKAFENLQNIITAARDSFARINKMWSDAVKGYQGQWVPTVMMGSNQSAAQAGGGAMDLVNLLTAKTAMDLGLDMKVLTKLNPKK